MTFGEKLQTLRKSKGLSQEQLAVQLSVSRQAISKWELGESKPDLDNIVQISNLFSVTTDFLLKDAPIPESQPTTEETQASNAVAVQILYIASVALMAIGLFSAFGGWYEEQTETAIWGGMIIQIVGLVGLGIGRVLSPNPVPFSIQCANYAIGVWMPVSMLTSLLRRGIITPYPTDFYAILIFLLLYAVILAVGYWLMKKHHNRINENQT